MWDNAADDLLQFFLLQGLFFFGDDRHFFLRGILLFRHLEIPPVLCNDFCSAGIEAPAGMSLRPVNTGIMPR